MKRDQAAICAVLVEFDPYRLSFAPTVEHRFEFPPHCKVEEIVTKIDEPDFFLMLKF